MAARSEHDMQRRTVLVTGATGGIGYETARLLARRLRAITGRDADRGEKAVAAIRRESDRESVHFMQADHSTVGGNQQLAEQVRAALTGLDVLVNNVGASADDAVDDSEHDARLDAGLADPAAASAPWLAGESRPAASPSAPPHPALPHTRASTHRQAEAEAPSSPRARSEAPGAGKATGI